MEYTVKQTGFKVDFGAEGVQEVLQNVYMIISTPAYTCPLHRDFAWVSDVIDAPIHMAQALIRARVAEAIQIHEPRAEVINIEFEGDALEGQLKPIVRVRIDETKI